MSSTPTSSTATTTKKEKNEEQFELEQQFILRMPPVINVLCLSQSIFMIFIYLFFKGEYADRLRDLIDSGDEKIRERLFIDLNPERRRGRVKFDDTVFKATLYDLPCVTETYKTFDRKTLYKIADIAQVNMNFALFIFCLIKNKF